MDKVEGFFVDWDGKTRRTEAPGDGYRCEVDPARNSVDVIAQDGCYIHATGFFPTLDSLRAAGITVEFAAQGDE